MTGLLAQPKMRSVAMIVRDVLGQKPPEMTLVQCDDVIEQIATATADPAFRNTVLPGALDGGLEASNAHGANRRGNFQPVFCVVIEDKEPRSGLIGEGFSQLLYDPTARRMAGNIEVQDAPAIMANNKRSNRED